MQVIELADEWRVRIRDSADMNVEGMDVSDWERMRLPMDAAFIENLTEVDRLWMQCAFNMPINEECSTWWLETNITLKGQVWVNGKKVDNPEGDEIYQLEVTNYIALDENVVMLGLEPTDELKKWEKLACVPYPCA